MYCTVLCTCVCVGTCTVELLQGTAQSTAPTTDQGPFATLRTDFARCSQDQEEHWMIILRVAAPEQHTFWLLNGNTIKRPHTHTPRTQLRQHGSRTTQLPTVCDGE